MHTHRARRHIARIIPTACLGLALLAPAALHHRTTEAPWGKDCHLTWCQPKAPAPSSLQDQLAPAVTVAKLMGTATIQGRDCAEVQPWINAHPGRVPGAMLWAASSTAKPQLSHWSYPVPAGSVVYLLCARYELDGAVRR